MDTEQDLKYYEIMREIKTYRDMRPCHNFAAYSAYLSEVCKDCLWEKEEHSYDEDKLVDEALEKKRGL